MIFIQKKKTSENHKTKFPQQIMLKKKETKKYKERKKVYTNWVSPYSYFTHWLKKCLNLNIRSLLGCPALIKKKKKEKKKKKPFKWLFVFYSWVIDFNLSVVILWLEGILFIVYSYFLRVVFFCAWSNWIQFLFKQICLTSSWDPNKYSYFRYEWTWE